MSRADSLPTPGVNPRDDAVAWKVRLQSGDASPADFEAFSRWRDAHPSHGTAWDRLQGISQMLAVMPPRILRSTLAQADADRARTGRRAVLKSVMLVGGTLAGAGATWSGYRWLPWQDMLADHHTAIGEQQRITLADDSRVTLNTNSAIAVRIDGAARAIDLLRGEVLLKVADRGRDQPLQVHDPAGSVSATAGRFAIRRMAGMSRAAVYEGTVRITCADGTGADLRAGQVACFAATGMGAVATLGSTSGAAATDGSADGAWADGVIVAQAMRLDDFVDELSRYRTGILHCAPEVADERISGVYPIANTDHALDAVTRVLPVAVHRRTRFWVTVSAA